MKKAIAAPWNPRGFFEQVGRQGRHSRSPHLIWKTRGSGTGSGRWSACLTGIQNTSKWKGSNFNPSYFADVHAVVLSVMDLYCFLAPRAEDGRCHGRNNCRCRRILNRTDSQEARDPWRKQDTMVKAPNTTLQTSPSQIRKGGQT